MWSIFQDLFSHVTSCCDDLKKSQPSKFTLACLFGNKELNNQLKKTMQSISLIVMTTPAAPLSAASLYHTTTAAHSGGQVDYSSEESHTPLLPSLGWMRLGAPWIYFVDLPVLTLPRQTGTTLHSLAHSHLSLDWVQLHTHSLTHNIGTLHTLPTLRSIACSPVPWVHFVVLTLPCCSRFAIIALPVSCYWPHLLLGNGIRLAYLRLPELTVWQLPVLDYGFVYCLCTLARVCIARMHSVQVPSTYTHSIQAL